MRQAAQQAGEADRLRRGYARALRQPSLLLLERALPESAAAYPRPLVMLSLAPLASA